MIATLLTALHLAVAGPMFAAFQPAGGAYHKAPDCDGALKQGGLILCNGEPGSVFKLSDGRSQTVDDSGLVTFGLRRDAPPSIRVTYTPPGYPALALETLAIATREDPVRVVNGVDCDKVDARTEEQKAHANRSWQKKANAWETFSSDMGPLTGWLKPADGPPSSPFGPVRKYIGVSAVTGEACESQSVHQGYDMAVPTGTTIIAPADGVVILADPDLYYEGGTVFLDHGYGLVSVFMHMSQVDVQPGDRLSAGDPVGLSGNTGRTTGPHLHWAVKWRDPTTTDRSGDFYIDPALLLELP